VKHPSVTLLELAFPADQIADAVLSGVDAAMAEVDLDSGPVRLAVHRGAEGIESQRLEQQAYEFVARLCAGEALGTLLESASAQAQAAALLAEQLTRGRLTGFHIGSPARRQREDGPG
jgi:hypothetical protein